jgi:hypothetical protein
MTGASNPRIISDDRANDARIERIARAVLEARAALADLTSDERAQAIEFIRAFGAMEQRGHLPPERANQ